MKRVLMLFLLAALMTTVAHAEFIWNDASGDNLYTNPANWDTNEVPGPGDIASFGPIGTEPNECVIDTDIYCTGFNMGLTAGVTNYVRIANGGYAHCDAGLDSSVVSYSDGAAAVLTVETGGQMDVGWQLTIGQWGFGTIIVDGGVINCQHLHMNSGPASHADIQILDGTLRIDLGIHYGASSLGGFIINIEDGELLIGDPAFTLAAAEAWINLGFITGYGELGNVVAEEVLVQGQPFRRLTADCNYPMSDGDVVRDCIINLEDFTQMASNWLATDPL